MNKTAKQAAREAFKQYYMSVWGDSVSEYTFAEDREGNYTGASASAEWPSWWRAWQAALSSAPHHWECDVCHAEVFRKSTSTNQLKFCGKCAPPLGR